MIPSLSVGKIRVACPGAELLERRRSKMRFGFPVSSTSVVATHGLAAVAEQRVSERVVSCGRAELAELDVEGDRLRLALADLVERLGVQRSR